MSGKWCPECGAEYIEGWGRCSNCGVDLVDEPPSRPAEPAPAEEPARQRAAASTETRRATRDDEEDPFIPIWEGPTPEGSGLARRLEAALIPVDLGEAAEAGRLRIEVPKTYLQEALGILDDADASPLPPPDDDEHATAGWSSASRVFLIVIVIVLVAVLLITTRY